MLGDKEVAATVAVQDIAVARKFYGGSLGLKEIPTDQEEVQMYRCGNSALMVYESEYARTNKATAATWSVGDEIGKIAKELKGKGVAFERYDFPGTTMEGDIHVMGDMRAAWFRDPDGNILALVNQ